MMHRTAPRGFTLLEITIVVIITAVILGATWAVFSAVIRGDEELRTRVELQAEAVRCLQTITSLLKQSGPDDKNGDWATVAVANANSTSEYWSIFTDAQGTDPAANLPAIGSSYDYLKNEGSPSMFDSATKTMNPAIVQDAALRPEEGLGPSQEILFRVAGDTSGDNLPASKAGSGMAIEFGRFDKATGKSIQQYHGFVVVPGLSGSNELQHRLYEDSGPGTAIKYKSYNVITPNVSRILFETKGNPAPAPLPMWPLPAWRARNQGETETQYQAAMPGKYPLPPESPFTIRVTICLMKKTLNGHKIAVWQQATVNVRTVQRG